MNQRDEDVSLIENNPSILNDKPKNKVHPWRLCRAGYHFVRTHPLHVPPSHPHPERGKKP